MLNLLTPVLVAVLTTAFTYRLSASLRAGRAVSFNGKAGTIRPERVSAWITIVVGLGMVAGAAWLTLAVKDRSILLVAMPLALMGSAFASFMAPSVTSVHSVSWDDTGIEGPSKTFGLTLGSERTAIPWEQIHRTGKTATGYWFVEAPDKRRIYWSYLYSGYGLLTEALQQRCPALSLPSDMI